MSKVVVHPLIENARLVVQEMASLEQDMKENEWKLVQEKRDFKILEEELTILLSRD